MRPLAKEYKRIVIKIGSSLFFRRSAQGGCPNGVNLDFNILSGITQQIIQLIKNDFEVIVVSSGAIALGMSMLKLTSRPGELSYLQAAAAIGQNELMSIYGKFFEKGRLNCAQLLLTWEDFDDRKRYLNARNTLLKVLKLKFVPIINENDTVSTDEIKFGDNDRLSALVSKLISADILIILSDVDGLLDKNKKVIPLVNEITPQIISLACPTDKKICVGGMVSKLEAAKIASGIPCVIANGLRQDIILSVIKEPEKHATLFRLQKGLKAREHWIVFSAKPKGKIIVDEGAKKALLNKKSLLSVGVTEVTGNFEQGEIVALVTPTNLHTEFARGKVEASSRELLKIKGQRSDKEVIHCDNIVIL